MPQPAADQLIGKSTPPKLFAIPFQPLPNGLTWNRERAAARDISEILPGPFQQLGLTQCRVVEQLGSTDTMQQVGTMVAQMI